MFFIALALLVAAYGLWVSHHYRINTTTTVYPIQLLIAPDTGDIWDPPPVLQIDSNNRISITPKLFPDRDLETQILETSKLMPIDHRHFILKADGELPFRTITHLCARLQAISNVLQSSTTEGIGKPISLVLFYDRKTNLPKLPAPPPPPAPPAPLPPPPKSPRA